MFGISIFNRKMTAIKQTVTKLAQNSRVSVIGSGISGLSFAYFLGKLRPDVKITVYEKENRVGGYINTSRANSKTEKETGLINKMSLKMEKGPRTLRGVSSGTLIIVDLLDKIGKLDQLRGVHYGSPGNRKYILTDYNGLQPQLGQITGGLQEVPSPGCNISAKWKFIFSKYGKFTIQALFRDFFFKQNELDPIKLNKMLDNMSVEEFCKRHFGKEIIDELGSALMYGVYAADVSDLNVNCVMKGMVDLEKSGGSIIRAVHQNAKHHHKKHKGLPPKQDNEVQMYINKFGTKINLLNLSKLLKKFPMLALTDGLSVLCNGLKDNMPSNVKFVMDGEVDTITKNNNNKKITIKVKGENNGKSEEFDHVRSTVSSNVLSNMIGDPKIKEKLKNFKYTSVTVCNVLIPKKDIKGCQGFGFLVPKVKFNPQVRVMGVIFDSDVEENSSVIFPNGDKSVPKILTDGSKYNRDLIKEFEKDVITRDYKALQTEGCTKVTFMLNIDRNNNMEATDSRLRKIVEETFKNILGYDLSNINKEGKKWEIEKSTLWDSIPLYDVTGEGFIVRKREILNLMKSEPISLGGMTFARGVGVPDNVVSSMEAAVQLSGV